MIRVTAPAVLKPDGNVRLRRRAAATSYVSLAGGLQAGVEASN
jgi:hypothetical protein